MSFRKTTAGIIFFLIPLAIILSVIIHETPKEHIEDRLARAEEYERQINDLFMQNKDSLNSITLIDPKSEPLTIAVVWPISTTDNKFIEGIKLAASEINQNGGIYGQPLKLKVYDTKGDLKHARKVALEICDEDDVMAVIGHFYSSIAQITSFIYANHGLLFITPGCQAQLHSLHNIDTFFRTIPNTAQMAKEAAFFTQQLNYRNPVIISEDDIFAQKFSKLYQTELNKFGIDVVYDFTLLKWKNNYKLIINQLKLFDYDLIVMAVGQAYGFNMLQEAVQMGVQEEFMTINLDAHTLAENPLYNSTTVYNMDMFDYENPSEELKNFVDKYYNVYGDSLKQVYASSDYKAVLSEEDFVKPDGYAAYGYDALKLLEKAVKDARSIHPLTLATYLQFNSVYDGLTGSNDFDDDGNVYRKPVYMSKVEKGKITKLKKEPAGIHSFTPRLKQELATEIKEKTVKLYSDEDKVLLLLEDHNVFNSGSSDIDSTGREILNKIAFAAHANDSILIRIKSVSKAEASSFSHALDDAIHDMETGIKASRITSFLVRYGVKHDQIYTEHSSIKHDEVFPEFEYQDKFADEHVEILVVKKSAVIDDSR